MSKPEQGDEGREEELRLTNNAPTSYTDDQQERPADKPPPYEFVVGRYRDLKTGSRNQKELVSKLGVCVFCNSVVFAITFVFCIVISLANIIIGSVYIDDCPRSYMIPIYLIVGGVVLLLRGILNIAELAEKRRSLEHEERYQRSMIFVCCDLPLWIFLVCWFVLGNIWIFGIKNRFQSTNPELLNYCDQGLYWYSFWITIIAYILMIIPLMMCCCVSCIACCGLADQVDSKP